MPELEFLFLQDDELEALRLCDLEGYDQVGAGERMGVSRGTVQRLLKSGRSTLVRALVENTALVVGSERDPDEKSVQKPAESTGGMRSVEDKNKGNDS